MAAGAAKEEEEANDGGGGGSGSGKKCGEHSAKPGNEKNASGVMKRRKEANEWWKEPNDGPELANSRYDMNTAKR